MPFEKLVCNQVGREAVFWFICLHFVRIYYSCCNSLYDSKALFYRICLQ